jgi:hypothetical protein
LLLFPTPPILLHQLIQLIQPKNGEEPSVEPDDERPTWRVFKATFVVEAGEKVDILADVDKARFPTLTNVHIKVSDQLECLTDRFWDVSFHKDNINTELKDVNLKWFTSWIEKTWTAISKLNATVIIDVLII